MEKVDVKTKLKTFMIINESFACPANCPYCTAKITKWKRSPHDWRHLCEKLSRLHAKGASFEYLTISGNGEPALIELMTLDYIRSCYKKHESMFDYARMQTCGEIFQPHQQKKWEVVKDFIFEITRVDLDPVKNAEILRYIPYDHLENFRNSKIIFNLVLLKEKYKNIVEDIKTLIQTFPNLITVNVKILNVNTLDNGDVSNPHSQWILQNGVSSDQRGEMEKLLSESFTQAPGYSDFADRYEWVLQGIPITMYARRKEYGLTNIVYYNGKLTDYQQNELKI
ncbi:MAG: hypothetical protein LBD11_02405 [Candidatus Peribacteria bacterium]|jgi:hypothetical protein|nr:hypothetical protein [Candidatus Peribacteria bacterium]